MVVSLNNRDILEDETKTLEDYGVVWGDLVYVQVQDSADTDSSASSSSVSQVSRLSVLMVGLDCTCKVKYGMSEKLKY